MVVLNIRYTSHMAIKQQISAYQAIDWVIVGKYHDRMGDYTTGWWFQIYVYIYSTVLIFNH